MSEWVDIVDEQNQVVGRALRSDCHGNPSLIHRAVHVMIFIRAGELLLQLRGKTKKIQPGKLTERSKSRPTRSRKRASGQRRK
jgi:isopentenyldiphosphate isomerase